MLLVSSRRPDVADVLLPAALAEPTWVAWLVRHTSGLLSTPMPADRADALHLPPMVGRGETPGTASYAVSVDAADGIGTGISARDRARTARVLADPETGPADLCRPGHVLPVRVGAAATSTSESVAVALCRAAGLPPVGLMAGLVAEDATTTEVSGEVAALARGDELAVVDIDDPWFCTSGGTSASRLAGRSRGLLSTAHGNLTVVEYRDETLGVDHFALHTAATDAPPRVSVHNGCGIGQLFGGTGCGCRTRLDAAVADTARRGGVLVCLRAEGERCRHGLTPDDASAALVAAVLTDLGISRARLDHHTPISPQILAARGIEVVAP